MSFTIYEPATGRITGYCDISGDNELATKELYPGATVDGIFNPDDYMVVAGKAVPRVNMPYTIQEIFDGTDWNIIISGMPNNTSVTFEPNILVDGAPSDSGGTQVATSGEIVFLTDISGTYDFTASSFPYHDTIITVVVP